MVPVDERRKLWRAPFLSVYVPAMSPAESMLVGRVPTCPILWQGEAVVGMLGGSKVVVVVPSALSTKP
jgi:hypothetical protein